MSEDLKKYRTKIDEIDQQIIELLAERFTSVKKIGELKKISQLEVVQNDRWQKVLENVRNLAEKYNLSEQFLVKIWEEIHQEAIKLEKEIVNE